MIITGFHLKPDSAPAKFFQALAEYNYLTQDLTQDISEKKGTWFVNSKCARDTLPPQYVASVLLDSKAQELAREKTKRPLVIKPEFTVTNAYLVRPEPEEEEKILYALAGETRLVEASVCVYVWTHNTSGLPMRAKVLTTGVVRDLSKGTLYEFGNSSEAGLVSIRYVFKTGSATFRAMGDKYKTGTKTLVIENLPRPFTTGRLKKFLI